MPLDVMQHIFESLPNFLTVIKFRQTCRVINSVYEQCKRSIMRVHSERVIAPIDEHYTFFTNLHIEKSLLKRPPPGGWPGITCETFKGMNKSEFAIEVLRRLPYIDTSPRTDDPYHDNYTNLEYKCNVIDYSSLPARDLEKPRYSEFYYNSDGCFDSDSAHFYYTPSEEEPVDEDAAGSDGGQSTHTDIYATTDDYKAHPLNLKMKHRFTLLQGYESGGVTVMLDVMRGLVFVDIVRCEFGPIERTAVYFEQKRREFLNFQIMFVPGHNAILWHKFKEAGPYDPAAMEAKGEPTGAWEADGPDGEWIAHLYRKFGWPALDWDQEGGLNAIVEYVNRRDV